jgi:hypothetical protein
MPLPGKTAPSRRLLLFPMVTDVVMVLSCFSQLLAEKLPLFCEAAEMPGAVRNLNIPNPTVKIRSFWSLMTNRVRRAPLIHGESVDNPSNLIERHKLHFYQVLL